MIAQALPQVHITAVELLPDMITVAQEEVEKEGLAERISLLQGDAADVELVDQLGQFDLVYATYSLHHWERPQAVIENLLQAVSPGGTLFIHDLKRVWWLYWIPSRSGFILSIRAAYTPAEIRDLLMGMGIERFEIQDGLFYQSVVIET
jgi:2-polyprenyl-3-methyl-5-hydroxy-6-metoxy-1,4-benzoquinol methylase